jgi:uncharacterized protein
MKILAVTDIHGAYEKATKIIKHEQADIVIIGGDLTNAGSLKEVEAAINLFKPISKKIFAITGNMDLPLHEDFFRSIGISLNGEGIVVGDIGFFGVSASPFSPLFTPNEISEESILIVLEKGYDKIKTARTKIMISHSPPYGSKVDILHSGIHVGSTAVREFIECQQPDVVICGHIHEARGQEILGKTKIVNCGQGGKGYYAIIEVNKNLEIYNKEFK